VIGVKDGRFNLFGLGIIKTSDPDKQRFLRRACGAFNRGTKADAGRDEVIQARKSLERMARKGNPWARPYLDALKTFAALPLN